MKVACGWVVVKLSEASRLIGPKVRPPTFLTNLRQFELGSRGMEYVLRVLAIQDSYPLVETYRYNGLMN